MNTSDYELLPMPEIACECHNKLLKNSKCIPKKRCSIGSYDEQPIYYERGGLVVFNDQSGKICVEYKKKETCNKTYVRNTRKACDDEKNEKTQNELEQEKKFPDQEKKLPGQENKLPDQENKRPDPGKKSPEKKICIEKGQIESCFPYAAKRKDSQCSAALYPYEVIRKFPFDNVCKCNEEKKLNEEVKPEDLPGSSTANKPLEGGKNKNSNSSKSITSADQVRRKSSLKKFNHKWFTKRLFGNVKDKLTSSISSDDLCNCFPDLNCQCPQTGEYKLLKNEYEQLKESPVKTKYLPKPCMQAFFNPCQNGVPSSLDDATRDNNAKQTVFLNSGTTCLYNNVPCCPCPKPDPDGDHPKYLSTKVNVTDLMKQLLTFHFNRSYMCQYYSRVQMDNTEEPCEICLDKIMLAAGCVGSCCKCPKPAELKSCNCPQSSESESESSSEDDQYRIRPFDNNNYNTNFGCSQIIRSICQNKCNFNQFNCKADYQCYNVMCTPECNEMNVCSQCKLRSGKNSSTHKEQTLQERTHCDKENRKTTSVLESVAEEIDTQSDEVNPLRKRNMFKGFFSKMKLDWSKKKNTIASTDSK